MARVIDRTAGPADTALGQAMTGGAVAQARHASVSGQHSARLLCPPRRHDRSAASLEGRGDTQDMGFFDAQGRLSHVRGDQRSSVSSVARSPITSIRPLFGAALRTFVRVAPAFAVAVAACSDVPTEITHRPVAAPVTTPAATSLTTRYIVVFADSVRDVPTAARTLRAMTAAGRGLTLPASGASFSRAISAAPTSADATGPVYTEALRGFRADLTADDAALLRRDPRVAYIEADGHAHATIVERHATGTTSTTGTPGLSVQNAPGWNLDRIDQVGLPLDQHYSYYATGRGTRIYILDTGIRLTHAQFGGRAVAGPDIVTPNGTSADCNGHGTHVAGTAGGNTVGVARAATLVGVRVLSCDGSGWWSDVIAGLDWVTADRKANPTRPAVVNMSLGGDASQALDDAVHRAVVAGVVVVVAAGNNSTDACKYSPARSADAITVGATTSADSVGAFSNVGQCVKIFAPGANVYSAWGTSDTQMMYATGTSMAAPAVAGTAALYLETNPTATPATVTSAITSKATTGKLTALRDVNSPNRLLYTGFIMPDLPPTATFTTSCVKLVCTFDASGSLDDKGIATYAWQFADQTTASGVKVTKTFATSGAFAVTLTVTDAAQQSDVITKTVAAAAFAPTAKFTVSCTRLTCSLNASTTTSSLPITTYLWRFGDNATSGGATVSKTFATPTATWARLIVTDSALQTDSVTQPITFTDTPPVAKGSVTCTVVTCTFSSASSTDDWGVTGVTWIFGDGQTTTAKTVGSVAHTYAASGSYTATLIVTDSARHADTAIVAVSVKKDNPPVAKGSVTCTVVTCTFSSASSTDDWGVTGVTWIFGDGQTTTAKTVGSVAHRYAAVGSYTAKLIVTDSARHTDTAIVAVSVKDNRPVAKATVSCIGRSCTFDGRSSTDDAGTVTYAWTFSHGGAATTPTVTLAFPLGTVTGTLTVRDSRGQTSSTTATVTVKNAVPTAGLLVACTARICQASSAPSTDDAGIAKVQWSFGDGTATVVGATASHTYAKTGTFTLTLTVTDTDGATATKTQSVTIATLTPLPVSFTPKCTHLACSYTVQLASGTKASTYSWAFGNGATSTSATPAATYAKAGTYVVTLTFKDATNKVYTLSSLVSVAP